MQEISVSLPPGPSTPFDLAVAVDSFDAIRELAEEYGDVSSRPAASRDRLGVLVNHPDTVARVLGRNHKNYLKGRDFERVKMLLGYGLIVSDGEHWKAQRKMIQPAFHHDVIARLSEIMRRVNESFCARWRRSAETGETINVTEEVADLALEIMVRTLFSDDYDALAERVEGKPFGFLITERTRDLAIAVQFRATTRVIQEIVDRRRSEPPRDDLVGLMMAARHPSTGEPMDDKALMDEITTMIIAGHETAATTMNWTWYLLSRHPRVEAELHREVDRLGRDDAPDFDDLPALGYARRVVEETLRLYPPVWLFSRRAAGEDRLGAYTVPAGADVFISPYFLHRRADFWPEPEVFDPERFAADRVKERHPYAYIPFSAGPRRCIGDFFGLVEMQIHFGLMSRHLRLRYAGDGEPEIEPAMNLRSREPLVFAAEPRAAGAEV